MAELIRNVELCRRLGVSRQAISKRNKELIEKNGVGFIVKSGDLYDWEKTLENYLLMLPKGRANIDYSFVNENKEEKTKVEKKKIPVKKTTKKTISKNDNKKQEEKTIIKNDNKLELFKKEVEDQQDTIAKQRLLQEKARTKKEYFAAEEMEIKVKKMRGELIELDSVIHQISSISRTLKQKLELFPDKISPIIASICGVDDVKTIKEAILDGVNDILSDFQKDIAKTAQKD